VGTEIIGIVGLTLLLVIDGAARSLLNVNHLFSTGVVPSAGYFNLGTLTSTGPFMLSFLLGAFTIVGFEAAANLAEETKEAHSVVPFAMWSSVVLSGVVGFAFLIALNLASGDIKALSASSTPVVILLRRHLVSSWVISSWYWSRSRSLHVDWLYSLRLLVSFGRCHEMNVSQDINCSGK